MRDNKPTVKMKLALQKFQVPSEEIEAMDFQQASAKISDLINKSKQNKGNTSSMVVKKPVEQETATISDSKSPLLFEYDVEGSYKKFLEHHASLIAIELAREEFEKALASYKAKTWKL